MNISGIKSPLMNGKNTLKVMGGSVGTTKIAFGTIKALDVMTVNSTFQT